MDSYVFRNSQPIRHAYGSSAEHLPTSVVERSRKHELMTSVRLSLCLTSPLPKPRKGILVEMIHRLDGVESTKKFVLAMVFSGALIVTGTICMIFLYIHFLLFSEQTCTHMVDFVSTMIPTTMAITITITEYSFHHWRRMPFRFFRSKTSSTALFPESPNFFILEAGSCCFFGFTYTL